MFVGEEMMGKSVYTGREAVWAEALSLAKNNLFLGFSNKIDFNGYLSAHNSLLAILCYFGVLGLIFSICVIYLSFKKLNDKCNSISAVAILAALVVMCFETVLTDWTLMWPFSFLFIHQESKYYKL